MTPGPPIQRLLDLLSSFSAQRVVILGDMVLDEFLYGRIDRVSREAPVLILEHQQMEKIPGGAANAAANIAALGGTALPIGLIGDDASGAALRTCFAERGIDTSGLVVAPGYETPTKTRVLAGSPTSVRQQVVRVDRGTRTYSIKAPTAQRLQDAWAGALTAARRILISDYDHGTVDDDLAESLAKLGENPNTVVTVDSRRHLGRFRNMTATAPNLEEASRVLGRSVPDVDDRVGEAATEMQGRLGAQNLVITRGSHGMTLLGPEGPPRHLPVYGTDEVADVTGAGDTVMAALTLALAAGASILEAARLANVAAGLVVMKRGTATVTPAEVRVALEEAPDAL